MIQQDRPSISELLANRPLIEAALGRAVRDALLHTLAPVGRSRSVRTARSSGSHLKRFSPALPTNRPLDGEGGHKWDANHFKPGRCPGRILWYSPVHQGVAMRVSLKEADVLSACLDYLPSRGCLPGAATTPGCSTRAEVLPLVPRFEGRCRHSRTDSAAGRAGRGGPATRGLPGGRVQGGERRPVAGSGMVSGGG